MAFKVWFDTHEYLRIDMRTEGCMDERRKEAGKKR